MDDLLKTYAKQRRDAAGTPEMHPVTRRLLQDEAAKLRPASEPAPRQRRWFSPFLASWPQLTAVASIVVVVGVGVQVLRHNQEQTERTEIAERLGISPEALREAESMRPSRLPLPSESLMRAESDKNTTLKRLAEAQPAPSSAPATAESIDVANRALAKSKDDRASGLRGPDDSFDRKQILADSSSSVRLARDEPTAPASRFALAPTIAPLSPPPVTAPPMTAPAPTAPGSRRAQGPATQTLPGLPAPAVDSLSTAFKESNTPVPPPAAKPNLPESRALQAALGQTGAASGAAAAIQPNNPLVKLEAADADRGNLSPTDGTSPIAVERQAFYQLSAINVSRARGAVEQRQRSDTARNFQESSGRNSTQAGAVLASFELRQAGDRLQAIDADGSRYDGRFEDTTAGIAGTYARQPARPAEPSSTLTPALRSDQGTAQITAGRRFRLTGTNQTLRQRVVFEGTLLNAPTTNFFPPQATLNFGAETKASTATGLPSINKLTQPILGTLQIGASNAIPVQAVPMTR